MSVLLIVGVIAQSMALAMALARLAARGYSGYWMAVVVLSAAFIGGAFAGWPVLVFVALALEFVLAVGYLAMMAGRVQR